MAAARFDDLIAALQGELMTAQNALRLRQRAVAPAIPVAPVATASREGGRPGGCPSSPSGGWHCSGTGAGRIASLALSFDCELRRAFPLAGVRALVMRGGREDGPGHWFARRARDRRRVRIVLDGRERAAGEVWLDERLFLSVPARGEPESGAPDRPEAHPVLWLLRRLLALVLRLDEFVLTREQTARVLAIARSVQKAASAGNPPGATE